MAPIRLSSARHAELCQAIESISREDLLRLLRFAETRAYGTELTGRDLFHEALELMLDGERCAWSQKTFVRDLYRIVRSVVSHKRASINRRQEREIAYTDQQTALGANEGQLDAANRVQRLRDWFEAQGDVEATLVIDGMAQGMSMREAAESLGLSDNQYDAVRKRIHRQKRVP